jgi:hypothetical protein
MTCVFVCMTCVCVCCVCCVCLNVLYVCVVYVYACDNLNVLCVAELCVRGYAVYVCACANGAVYEVYVCVLACQFMRCMVLRRAYHERLCTLTRIVRDVHCQEHVRLLWHVPRGSCEASWIQFCHSR